MMYYQCTLENESGGKTVGWIEAKGAKVGKRVELLEYNEYFTVKEVFLPGMESKDLAEKQRMDRGSLPSIKEKV